MDDPPERTAPEARVLALAKTGDLDAFEQLDLFPRLADLFLVLTTKVY
jgi:hypothetical protein